jgi:hypothetical protein
MTNEILTHDVDPEAERLAVALGLEPGETLERAYVFDPIERGGVAFRLALVTKRRADGSLEMAALGGRADQPHEIDFARRARFPDEVLPSILGELIERCDAEGAAYREVELDIVPGAPAVGQVAELIERIRPPDAAR